MQINWGEDYSGPGQTDASKSRSEREAELRRMLNSRTGHDIVFYHFAKYSGILGGKLGPVGASVIQTILNHEYPGVPI